MLDLQQSKYLDVQQVHRQGLGQLFLTVPTKMHRDYPEAAREGGAIFVFVPSCSCSCTCTLHFDPCIAIAPGPDLIPPPTRAFMECLE